MTLLFQSNIMLPLLPPKSCNLGVFTIMSMGLYCFDFRPLLGDLGELLSANESQRLLAVAGARHRRADALSSPLCCSARLPAVMFTIVLMSVKKFFMQPNYVMPSCLSNPTPNLAESCCPYTENAFSTLWPSYHSVRAMRAQLLCNHVQRVIHGLSKSFRGLHTHLALLTPPNNRYSILISWKIILKHPM